MLKTGEERTLKKQIAALKQKLKNPSETEVEQWVADQRLRLRNRGNNFQLLPVNLIKVSTPNVGKGFDIEPPNFVNVSIPSGLLAYDVSMRLPKTDKPITGLRVVFHPDAKLGGARGYGTLPHVAASLRDANSSLGETHPRAPKPTFVLTSFSASAESVPGDNVNLNRLLSISRVTADSWLETYRPENVLDTRNKNGWSPDPTTDGPTHLTVTFAAPLDSARTPFITTQLNFGHGSNLVAARFEILAMTGTDDGSALPQEIVDMINKNTAVSGSAGVSLALALRNSPLSALTTPPTPTPPGATASRSQISKSASPSSRKNSRPW